MNCFVCARYIYIEYKHFKSAVGLMLNNASEAFRSCGAIFGIQLFMVTIMKELIFEVYSVFEMM